tara:strand:- start:952 stop:2475 length:1524 start_codon:yes stop_codon:yes gene_type:complete
MIYYAIFVTYTANKGEENAINIERLIYSSREQTDTSGITKPLIGLIFIAFSVAVIFISNIVIIFAKSILFTQTVAQTLMYITEIFKYLLLLGLIGGAITRIPKVASLLNNNANSALPIATIKYLSALFFYIPCLITDTVADMSKVGRNTPKHVLIVFGLQCCLIVFNVIIPMIDRYVTKHYVNTILEGPIYLSNEYNYSDMDVTFTNPDGCVKKHIDDKYNCKVELMDKDNVTENIQQDNLNLYFPGKTKREVAEARGPLSDDPNEYKEKPRYDYNYSYSFWFYINSTTDNKNEDLPMIDFAKNPEVTYNPVKNQLKVIYNGLEAGVLNHIKLQKWNHLVINYTSGRMDVFINGDLATTKNGMRLNTRRMLPIISGQYNGINGRIASVVYYHKPLSKVLIDFIYNSGKDKDVPKGGGLISTLWITSFNEGEQKTVENISDGIATIMTKILPTPDSLEKTYKYFENLPHNVYIDSWMLIDKYIFMFDTTVDNRENALEEKYKITTQLM